MSLLSCAAPCQTYVYSVRKSTMKGIGKRGLVQPRLIIYAVSIRKDFTDLPHWPANIQSETKRHFMTELIMNGV